ncbi:MFS transporter [Streptomyces sp. NPDC057557]|uniref:MFS transporter n=1 Tax=Streptomyces sp. NPDC057557 TaxID=3346167 RepID=UPI003677A4C0
MRLQSRRRLHREPDVRLRPGQERPRPLRQEALTHATGEQPRHRPLPLFPLPRISPGSPEPPGPAAATWPPTPGRQAWRTVLIGVFALATATGGYYVVTSFLLSYGTGDLHLSESMLLNGLTLAAFLELLVTPWLSWLADRVGSHKVVIAGLVGVVVLALPQFMVLIGIVCTARLHRLGRTQAETRPRTPAAREAVPTAT